MGAPTPPRPTGPRPTPRPAGPDRGARRAALARARDESGAIGSDAAARPAARADRTGAARPAGAAPALVAEPSVLTTDPVLGPAADAGAASKARAPGYLPGLDGLRAVCVLAVVAYHLGELRGGFLGVDVFFVISGFLITRLLLAERRRTGRIALGAFWRRRFKRLVPALLVVLVAVSAASRAWLPAWRMSGVRNDSLGALLYVANWSFVLRGTSYFADQAGLSPLRHTWSLAIEEQYYVLWPLLVVGVLALARGRSRRAVGTLALVGTVASGAWMAIAAARGFDLSRIYFGTDTRCFAIFAGAFAACWFDGVFLEVPSRVTRRRRARWAGWAAVAAAIPAGWLIAAASADGRGQLRFMAGPRQLFALDADRFYQGGFQLMAVLTVVVVVGVATGQGPLSRAMAHPVLAWIGRRSYGIYLWSWPTQILVSERFRLEGLALDGVVVAGAFALATLSYWLVEEPVRTGRRPAGFPARPAHVGELTELAERVGRRRLRTVPAWATSVGAVGVVVAVVVGTASGAPPAPTYLKVTDAEALDAAGGKATAAELKAMQAAERTTIPIDEGPPGPFTGASSILVPSAASVDPSLPLGRPLKVMIAGDSVGWSIGWDLGDDLTDTVAPDDRALIGCGVMPPSAQFIVGSRDPETYPELCQQAEVAEFRGLGNHPDVVLLWIGAWEVYDQQLGGRRYDVGTRAYADVLDERLQTRIDLYRSVGAPTVMALLPCFAPNAARLGNERHEQDRLDWVNARLRAVARRNRGWVRLIDPGPVLCTPDGHSIAKTPTGLPLREDGSHFDPPAATWFWNAWLAGQLGAAFPTQPEPPTTTTTTASTPTPSDPNTRPTVPPN
jgi:peptidoglycan/LPS O-acetylase OafA/YrhL